MKYDIYEIKGKKSYVLVEAGADVTTINVDANMELTPYKMNHDITSRPGLIGADPRDIIKDIEEKSYSIQGVSIK